MGQGEAQQGANVSDQSAVDKFQAGIDDQAAQQIVTGIGDLFSGNVSGAVAAFDKANQIESAPVATGGGGGYKFSPAQIEDQLGQCQNLIAGLQEVGLKNAQTIASTPSPAADTVASVPQAQAVQQMGKQLELRIQNQINFIKNWMSQLEKVRQSYLDQEGHTVDMWKKLSGGSYVEQS